MSVACPSCGYYIHHSTGRAMRAASGIARFTPSSSNRALHAAVTTRAFTLKASPMAPPLIDLALYVDDMFITSDASERLDAELAELQTAFPMTLQERRKH
eukprot:scaffold12139_cov111-Isochrysis_galbana.AAC.2